jgi:hypothetical protein
VLAEKFINEEPISSEELKAAIRRAVVALRFQPVFMGSAFKNKGVQVGGDKGGGGMRVLRCCSLLAVKAGWQAVCTACAGKQCVQPELESCQRTCQHTLT